MNGNHNGDDPSTWRLPWLEANLSRDGLARYIAAKREQGLSPVEIKRHVDPIIAKHGLFERSGPSAAYRRLADDAAAAPVEYLGTHTAGIAFMLTNAMRAELAARGFSADEIGDMTPVQAREILDGKPPAGAEPIKQPPKQRPRDINDVARQDGLGNVLRLFDEARVDEPLHRADVPDSETGSATTPPVLPLVTFSAAEFEGVEPPPRRWLVKDRVPMGNVMLLAGDGATGKTTIALQLAACVAGGLSGWLNGVVEEHGPVLFFTAEEDRDEVHRRLLAITKHHDIKYPPGLRVHCAVELNPQLVAAKGRFGQLEPTPVYEALRPRLETLRPKLLVLESSADLFGGDEINRAQVRLFVSFLRKLARDFDCAVILLSHPSVRGMADDSGTSGNTGWNNSVRARMYFKAVEDSPGLRKLEIKKSNYGPPGEVVVVQWTSGIYVPEPQPGSLERDATERKADELFLTILRRFASQDRNVSDKPSSSYAPAVFAKEPEAKDLPKAKETLTKAMARLFYANRLRNFTEGSFSRQRSRIVEVDSNAPSNDPSNALPTPSNACVYTPPITPRTLETSDGRRKRPADSQRQLGPKGRKRAARRKAKGAEGA